MDKVLYWFVFMFLLCGSKLSFGQDITIKSNFNSTIQEDNAQGKYTKAVDNSAPSGFNDKYHGTSNHNATKKSDRSQSHFWLVPPFIIGASVAIVVYIICNCFYIHCYAHKKIKKMAEKHFSSPILLTEEGSSSGSYQAFTPIVTYNEGQEEPGHFLFYQPYSDNEWEFSIDESSNRSSIRGSIKSRSSFKKSILPKRLFSKKQQPNTSTSSAPEELQPDGRKKASICLVPFNRSQSVPDKELGTKRMIYAPMMLPRVHSLKTTTSSKKHSIKSSNSDANVLPQAPLLIIGKGEGIGKVVFRQTSVSSDILGTSQPSGETKDEIPDIAEKPEELEDTAVTFDLDGGEVEMKEPLGEIHEESEDKA